MNRFTSRTGLLIFAVLALAAWAVAGVPDLMNYQGILANSSGEALDTTVSMTFTIYDDSTGGNPIWTETHPSVAVTDGGFDVQLGKNEMPPCTTFADPERWLGIAVGSDPEIEPRTRLVSAPYAFHAAYVDFFHPGPNNTASGLYTFVAGDSNTVTGDYSSIIGGVGNSVDVIYTADTAITEEGTFTKEPDGSRTGLGGGGGGFGNSVPGTASGVFWGSNNTANGAWSFIGGGFRNTTTGHFSAIPGGHSNRVGTGSTPSFRDGRLSVVGGGYRNTIAGDCSDLSVIGGGHGNSIEAGYATIAGGARTSFYDANSGNTVYDIFGSIGGGGNNKAGTNFGGCTDAPFTTISGGKNHVASGEYSSIGGGEGNTANNGWTTVAGGWNNQAGGELSTVGGGLGNYATGDTSFIGGGYENNVSGNYGTIGGGFGNQAYGFHSAVGGGYSNQAGDLASIGGGTSNVASGATSRIGGGESNIVTGAHSTIGGGYKDTVNSSYGTVGGGYGNRVAPACDYGTIGGGLGNRAGNDMGTIGGGQYNIALGYNTAIGGGARNEAAGNCATIPGGMDNIAYGSWSLAAGNDAIANHDHTFVWNDASAGTFTSTGINQFLIHASGGVGIGTAAPATALDVNGVITCLGCNGCSDARYKKDVETLDSALDRVLRLRGVNFNWIQGEFANRSFVEDRQIGFIAQEIREIVPEVVTQGNDGYFSVDYGRLTPVLVEAIKELKTENDDLRSQLANINAELNQLSQQNTTEIQALKAQTAQLQALIETVMAQQNNTRRGSDKLAVNR